MSWARESQFAPSLLRLRHQLIDAKLIKLILSIVLLCSYASKQPHIVSRGLFRPHSLLCEGDGANASRAAAAGIHPSIHSIPIAALLLIDASDAMPFVSGFNTLVW